MSPAVSGLSGLPRSTVSVLQGHAAAGPCQSKISWKRVQGGHVNAGVKDI